MAVNRTGKRLLWAIVTLAFLLVVSAGVLVYLSTRPVEFTFAQDPNPLEAHEATRKLNLLNEARSAKRRGYIRLSEVEINSFLDARYNKEKNSRTNLPVRIVKSGVLLHQTNLTFVTWIKAPVFGLALPFVWQRTVSPVKKSEKWEFDLSAMRLGRIEVPKALWARLSSVLGQGDGLFDERKVWLENVPKIALMKNEMSHAPELRLFSYHPEEQVAQ